jgi:hypothetical protein
VRWDLPSDHARILVDGVTPTLRSILVADLHRGHHAVQHAAVLADVNALRSPLLRFARAFRAAFGH